MIEFNYNKEVDIIFVKRQGEIYLKDVIEYSIVLDKDYSHLDNLYVLDDMGDSRISKIRTNDFNPLINEIKTRIQKYKKVKTALLVINQRDTAITYLFETMSKHISNFSCKVFSTEEAAKEWLLDR